MQDQITVGVGLACDLGGEARLADPRFPGHEEQQLLAPRHHRPGPPGDAQLPAATHERRRGVVGEPRQVRGVGVASRAPLD